MQFLKSGSSYKLYTRYGRVGEHGTQNFAAHDGEKGLKTFDKTLNAKSRKGYKVVDMCLGSDSKDITPIMKKNDKAESEFEDSKLEARLKNLMEFITDNKAMEKTLVDSGYDIKKMPIDKLSETMLKQGYVILNEIQKRLLEIKECRSNLS